MTCNLTLAHYGVCACGLLRRPRGTLGTPCGTCRRRGRGGANATALGRCEGSRLLRLGKALSAPPMRIATSRATCVPWWPQAGVRES